MGRRIPHEVFEPPFDVRRALAALRASDWLDLDGGFNADVVADWNRQAPRLWEGLESGGLSAEDVERDFPDWVPALIAIEGGGNPYVAQVAITRALIDGNEDAFVRAVCEHEIDIDQFVSEITDLASVLAPERSLRLEQTSPVLPPDMARSDRAACARHFVRELKNIATAARQLDLSPQERVCIPSLLGQLDLLVPTSTDPRDLLVANSLLRELVTSEVGDVWVGTPPAFALGLSRTIQPTEETAPNPYGTGGGFGRTFVPHGSVQAPEMTISAIDWRAGPRTGFLSDESSSRYVLGGFLNPFEHGYILQCNLRACIPRGGAGLTHLVYDGAVRKTKRDDNEEATRAMWDTIRAIDLTARVDSLCLGTFDSATHTFTEPVETVLARFVHCLLARGCVDSQAVRRLVAEHFPNTTAHVGALERWNERR